MIDMESAVSPFLTVAVAAFPPDCQSLAREAALVMSAGVDHDYHSSVRRIKVMVNGAVVHIPERLHFTEKRNLTSRESSVLEHMMHCLRTRSTDGYQRQEALRHILPLKEPWVIPFVVLLAGEYVVEIIDEAVKAFLVLDRAAYGAFFRENSSLMRLLDARASSYWDCYYRHAFRDRRQYPGIRFLDQIRLWAQQFAPN